MSEVNPPAKVSLERDEDENQDENKSVDSDLDPVDSEDKPEEEKEEEKVEVWGVRPVTLPPDESPLDQNGYAGVDPDYQREPLDQ